MKEITMGDIAWKALVKLFADGREICNCGEAYYSPCAHGVDGDGVQRDNMLACKHGCSANLISAKYEIAARLARPEVLPITEAMSKRGLAVMREAPMTEAGANSVFLAMLAARGPQLERGSKT